MRITLYGAGYVGLVTATCFAELGNEVLCVDIDAKKVALLQQGTCPIHEPGLEALMVRNIELGRLRFTTDFPEGVSHGFLQFIAVGTPESNDGAADCTAVYAVAQQLGKLMQDYQLVVVKSTVPVGTNEKVGELIQQQLNIRQQTIEFDLASNPEFLREGAAVDDFMNSDRIVVGCTTERAKMHLKALYAPFNRNQDRLISMDIRSSELTKYAANAMLATKISFINEMSNLAERVGADIESVRVGIGADPRIGYHFINPGCGFGGSCFPKDIYALERLADSVGYDLELIRVVRQVNYRQKQVLFQKIQRYFAKDLKNKVFAVWGLSFKPNTDDLREASSAALFESLWAAGARVQAYDPAAGDNAQRQWGQRADFVVSPNPEAALEGADALVVLTEWNVFLSPDFVRIKQKLKNPVIFDGRNLYDPAYLAHQGIEYYAIGRGLSIERNA